MPAIGRTFVSCRSFWSPGASVTEVGNVMSAIASEYERALHLESRIKWFRQTWVGSDASCVLESIPLTRAISSDSAKQDVLSSAEAAQCECPWQRAGPVTAASDCGDAGADGADVGTGADDVYSGRHEEHHNQDEAQGLQPSSRLPRAPRAETPRLPGAKIAAGSPHRQSRGLSELRHALRQARKKPMIRSQRSRGGR
ncbi:unnamed protein product [Prorocentrum cordatum]|uniref:Uncharacterized protein n=1 Tax=Prorocentrum cordatum TaxID=2364126 RepID=A0ABN9SDL2_9DINO|nr:unnamed protein product [Polarella glacialis]